MDIWQTLIGVLFGSSMIGFIEFLIHRKDEKDDKNAAVMKKLEEIEGKIDALENKVDENEEKRQESVAIASRIRVLKFADEIREGRRHTKDSFDQCNSDITTYERYCEKHHDFKNNQTAATIAFLNDCYAERLEKNDFL